VAPKKSTRGVTVGELIDDALIRAQDHKDKRKYISKAAIVRGDLGPLPLDVLWHIPGTYCDNMCFGIWQKMPLYAPRVVE
jgi:hypothetical protein